MTQAQRRGKPGERASPLRQARICAHQRQFRLSTLPLAGVRPCGLAKRAAHICAGGQAATQQEQGLYAQGRTGLNNEVVSTLGNRALVEPASGPAPSRAGEPLLEIQDLNVQFVTSHGTVRAVEGLSYEVHPGEMVAIVGESGSGKSVSALAVMQLLPAGTARIQGLGPLRRPRAARPHRRGDAQDPRPRHRDDLPGADDLAQPGAQDRAADHGAAHHPPRHGRCEGARAGDRAADAGRHHRPREPARPVSAPALGRHAPARDDRHRACLQSQAPDRRRAHHRARRHHPGADPGADEGPLAPARRGGRHHHPQPRHRRPLRRPRERHVCGAPGRERHRRARVRRGRCIPTRAAC